MIVGKEYFKKPSLYFYMAYGFASLVMFFYALISLFVFGPKDPSFLMFLLQLIFSIVEILVLVIFGSMLKVWKLKISETIKIFVLTILFLLFGVYPCFDLFKSKIATPIMFALIGIFFAMLFISIYYHFAKDSNGQARARKTILLPFMILFGYICSLVFELIILFTLFASGFMLFKNAAEFFLNSTYALIGIAAITISTWISLILNKKFINLCLVRQIKD